MSHILGAVLHHHDPAQPDAAPEGVQYGRQGAEENGRPAAEKQRQVVTICQARQVGAIIGEQFCPARAVLCIVSNFSKWVILRELSSIRFHETIAMGRIGGCSLGSLKRGVGRLTTKKSPYKMEWEWRWRRKNRIEKTYLKIEWRTFCQKKNRGAHALAYIS